MKIDYSPIINRRTTLKWLAATTASVVSGYSLASTYKLAAYNPTPKGYGTDPDMNHPVVPWQRTMTPHQLQLTAVLSDLILPGTDSAPSPSAIGIPDFVDEWVSAPYPTQQSDRVIILNGLAWVDGRAKALWGHGFLEADDRSQRKILDSMATRTRDAVSTAQSVFFQRLRFVVVGAYYSTPEGFKDIGYIGNVPLTSYPPPTKEEIAILEGALRKLGIT